MKTAADILREHDLRPPSTAIGRYNMPCPRCSAGRSRAHQKAPCLGISITDKGVMFGCNHCGWKGGAYYDGKVNGHDRASPFTGIYDYTDENGALLFQVCRKPDKTFPQRKPDGKGGWTWKTGDVRKVLYRLPELFEAMASEHVVFVVEGEKDVESLRKIGVPATCNPGGASEPDKQPKWRPEYSEILRGADIVIVPDNDAPGRAHAETIAQMSAGIAVRVRILDLAKHWPGCPKGGDVSDWLAAGHTCQEPNALIEGLPDWSPASVPNPSSEPEIFTAAALQTMTFPPLKFVLPNIVPEGATLLVSRPKLGKSWLVLDLAFGHGLRPIYARRAQAVTRRRALSRARGWPAAVAAPTFSSTPDIH
jgi:hypothetical protein